LAVLAYFRSEPLALFDKVSLSLAKWALPLTLPLVLSVVGAMLVNMYNDNRVLLIMILVISLLAGAFILNGKVYSEFYILAVFIISVALLYHSSLISRYICTFGSDVSLEYFVFKYTQMNGHWASTYPSYGGIGLGRLNNMLSITILPTAYSNLLNLDSAWIFKLVFPLIFAFVPLCLYQVWREDFRNKYAFISVFFFVTTAPFYTELLGLNRQMIAELFFVLLLSVLLNKRMNKIQRFFSFAVFGFGLVVSHYGLAELFLFFIMFALACLLVFKRRSNRLTVGMVVLFFAIMFVWYIYTSNASVFESFLEYADHIKQQLGDFFNPEARGETVLRGLGFESPPTIWNAISRLFAYVTEFLIVVGFVSFVLNKKMVNVEWEHFILISEAMGFLAALIVVPGLAGTMNMTRFYHILLFFLAPLCVYGGEFIVKFVLRRKSEFGISFLLVLVLVPYFMFQTGFVYEVVEAESWSLPLSGYRMSGYKLYCSLGYTDDWSVFSAAWVHNHVNVDTVKVYGDYASYINALRNYGFIFGDYINQLSNVTLVSENAIVHLNSLNVFEGMVVAGRYICNSSELSFLNAMNMIYSNGGSYIYENAP
jgi:uncharacterized membrane protein